MPQHPPRSGVGPIQPHRLRGHPHHLRIGVQGHQPIPLQPGLMAHQRCASEVTTSRGRSAAKSGKPRTGKPAPTRGRYQERLNGSAPYLPSALMKSASATAPDAMELGEPTVLRQKMAPGRPPTWAPFGVAGCWRWFCQWMRGIRRGGCVMARRGGWKSRPEDVSCARWRRIDRDSMAWWQRTVRCRSAPTSSVSSRAVEAIEELVKTIRRGSGSDAGVARAVVPVELVDEEPAPESAGLRARNGWAAWQVRVDDLL